MPRKSSSVPKRQRGTKRAVVSDTPRMLSVEEKHELIRAHVASRMPQQDPLQRVSLWAGVTLTVAVLAGGWWFTVGQRVQQSASGSSGDLQRITEELNRFSDAVEADPTLRSTIGSGSSEAPSFADQLQDRLSATRTHELLSPSSATSVLPGVVAGEQDEITSELTPHSE